jgi:hypothetical protein
MIGVRSMMCWTLVVQFNPVTLSLRLRLIHLDEIPHSRTLLEQAPIGARQSPLTMRFNNPK